jgi:hypothetical protein
MATTLERTVRHAGAETEPATELRAARRPATAIRWSVIVAGLGVILLLGQMAFVTGAAWDIQWHLVIGRDRPLIPPHLLLLAGIVLTGIASLVGVLGFTIATRTSQQVKRVPVPAVRFLGIFRAPLGLYVAGLGALLAAIAFPLDDYWHRLYGLDVTLWAPFHVMIITGMALASLGTAHLFALPLLAAVRGGNHSRQRMVFGAGVSLALAAVMATSLLLLGQAMDREGIIAVGPQPLVAYPPLMALLTIPWLVAAAIAVPFPGGATITALALTALRYGLFWFVPWAVRWAAALEGETIRSSAPPFVATPFSLPAWILLAGVLIDVFWWVARHRRFGQLRGLKIASLFVSGVVASLALATLDTPWQRTIPLVRGGAALDLQAALVNSLPLVAAAGTLGVLLGVLVGMGLRQARV